MKGKLLLLLLMFRVFVFGQYISFPPTPNEDETKGLNVNCYLTAIGHPTQKEKAEFINLLKPYVDSICSKQNLPKKTVMAMLILEAGFGFTRTGYYANNLGGVKKWTKDTANLYVLKGQPDENEGKCKVIRKTKNGQLIFDEIDRPDNRYRKFISKQDFVLYLTSTLLHNKRYKPYSDNYAKNLKKGISEIEASLIYAFELAQLGKYNHQGGKYYRNAIENVIKSYKL
ncbi:glucosaminidase domain-containing protein [Flectobacillus roseus]|uniref:Mannosyl-glycoprotein endo-beta-N-acetylglucosamidase-like domain-containing protein n=1 Tax=Flectobacillus roseus TaxID=502259 RepID=A0ABT6Y324_9BACT|nr:glucosaminidase domain-containing protein [Flectobacillus roseus]MDI9857955.1 hypothetical protein [Flectobacillus roseus]